MFLPAVPGAPASRWCIKCDKRHPVVEGEVWAAFSPGFLMRRRAFYTLAFGQVYDVTSAAGLLGLPQRVKLGAHAAVRMPLVPEGASKRPNQAEVPRRGRGARKKSRR